MKNILSILVGLLVVLGCADSSQKKSEPEIREMDNTSDHYDRQYRVYTLEGCEYIVANDGSSTWGSHKGNCKNPIHYKK